MKALLLKLALAAALCGASAGALAHRFHTGITEIAHNDKTGSVEVVHTLMAHDIDALLAMRAKGMVDVGERAGEELLRKYIDAHFYLLDADGKRLPLKWLGLTAGVESVVVYQELEQTALERVARVHHDILADYLPNQTNTLNVRRDGAIRSQTFTRKNSEQPLK
ncbi:MAG TPA: DUF6702 family protein [Telluria sp.]|jgi:hypothetical protein